MRLFALFACVLAVAAPTAAAGDNMQACSAKQPDEAIRACTSVIGAGARTLELLAVAYTNRGAAYASQQAFDQSIADYTRAIEFDPTYARAYDLRGAAHHGKGDYARAVADVTKAVELRRAPKPVPTPVLVTRRVAAQPTARPPAKRVAKPVTPSAPPPPVVAPMRGPFEPWMADWKPWAARSYTTNN